MNEQAKQEVLCAVDQTGERLGIVGDELGEAHAAVGLLMSKRVVTSEDLRGYVAERIPGAFPMMAKALNLEPQELSEMLERGEVLAEVALPAFARELREAFGIKEPVA